ncbi:uncharacterized protein B0H64DRAFT_403144 [Chaetomium fimeti]|uniref:Uncharacterized protein n=1 Tax=Chaetomium fimeti TaxID=1854472 RepID=A0AAE0HAH1_9PEZI|nr:hypothetical protein B0H64DRAFT_403144 [Chaetomium fimeti]
MEPQDMALLYDDIDSFVASPASNLELRSLTLRLTQTTLLSHEPQDVETNNLQVEQTLTRLAGAIAPLNRLCAFSLYVPPHNSGHHFEISQTAIASIIESLPQSCVSLEIDTAGLDHATTGPGSGAPIHLCETLRTVLPQMRYARLSLRTMCSSLFGTGAVLPQSDASPYNPITLPNMQGLLVNCKRAWGTAPICAASAQTPAPTPAWDSWDSVTHGLQTLATEPGRVRPTANLCVLTSTPQDNSDKSKYVTLIRADIASQTSHAFPVAFVSRGPTAWLMRTGEGREVISSDTAALVDAAEGQTGWATAGNGLRLPVQLVAKWGLETRESALDDGSVWRASNPRKMHLLWYNEKLCGERLLDGEMRVGKSYLSREPLVERTPAGWQRPDTLLRAQLEPL